MRVVDDADAAVETIKEVMGGYHATYADAAIRRAGGIGLVLQVNGDIAGAGVGYTAKGSVKLGVVYYIVVRSQFRGRGFSRVLIASLEEILSGMGAEVLYTTVERDNEASIRAFSSMCYSVFEPRELANILGYRALMGIMHAACSYEDEVVLIKNAEKSLDVLSRVDLDSYRDVWWEACYKPWMERWYPRRLGL